VAFLAVFGFAPWAPAQFSISSATLTISCDAYSPNAYYPDSATGPASGSFNDSVNTTVMSSNGNASQNSFVGTMLLAAVGSAGASSSVGGSADGTVGADGSSSFDVVFQVTSPVQVTLTGNIQANINGVSGFNLKAAGASLIDASAKNGESLNVPVSYSGTLSPGIQYELSAGAQEDVSLNTFYTESLTSSGSYNISLAILPEPAALAFLMGALPFMLCRPGRARALP
jgi:hypothetical protein